MLATVELPDLALAVDKLGCHDESSERGARVVHSMNPASPWHLGLRCGDER